MLGKPVVWIAAAVIGIMMLGSDTIERHVPAVAKAYHAVFGQDHVGGLGAAIAGGHLSSPWMIATERQRVYDATAKEFFRRTGVATSELVPPEVSSPAQPFESAPLRASQWLASVGIWFVFAFLSIAFALGRRPDV